MPVHLRTLVPEVDAEIDLAYLALLNLLTGTASDGNLTGVVSLAALTDALCFVLAQAPREIARDYGRLITKAVAGAAGLPLPAAETARVM